ncbi:TRAM domain-containing protein [Candidatus Saccharibacteria bacterium]|nr:TRAM domain-containing protein [Candidatus Saccharibacteria bacterium]
MELFILITCLAIFSETSILLARKLKPATSGRRKIYVDTSALIDGRILGVARSGFIDGDLIIPKTVLLELQLLADGKDAEKRNRARAGLDTVAELERVLEVNTEVVDNTGGLKKVDEELLRLAKENRGTILTIDYNLIKVAEAEKIPTLNINDLAIATRSEYTPGEKVKIRILEKGSNKGQGVGHLNDGTMIVVDNAAGKVGHEVYVEIMKFYETPAGKMVFARLSKGPAKSPSKSKER